MKQRLFTIKLFGLTRHTLHRLWPVLLFFLIIPGTFYLFLYGLPMTHDGATHLLRIARLDEHIRQGVLFPRWMPDLILGYGYPVLNYYASATYYLVEALHLLGFNLYYAFIVAQISLMYLAAVGMYLFARDLYGKRPLLPALVTSIAYVYAPYLLINIYVRGAIAELGAQMLLPWILWSFRRIWLDPQPRRYVLLATFALGALAWTHTISLLIIPLVLVAYLLLLLSLGTDRWGRLGWSTVAIVGAMGISCFYWLPLIVERHYISDVGFAISKSLMLPISFIDWNRFIDTGFFYTFREDPPYRFSLIQVAGALIGLLFVWRSAREIWFWLGVMALCFLMMTTVTRPIWFSNDILPIIQFPWRLQALFQFPVAILFGLPLTLLRNSLLRAASALVIIAVLISVHLPALPWAYLLSPESKFDMAVNAYLEVDRTNIVKSGAMTTTVQEFRPKWATQTLTLDPATVADSAVKLNSATPPTSKLTLLAADPFRLRLQVAGDTAFPLRFATYFFPGWAATLDGAINLTPYPSTNLGLLTVDVPAGEHTLTIAWAGTGVAFAGGLVSQITLLLIAIGQLTQRARLRWWGALPLLALAFGLTATYVQPPLPAVQPSPALKLPGLQLLGYQQPTVRDDSIFVQLYWLTTTIAPAPLQIRWQLRADDQSVVAETVSAPYYDAFATEEWASNTVVDDAYLIPLPAQLPSGRYTVVMAPLEPGTARATTELTVGRVTLPARRAGAQPQNALTAEFENAITLHGYDLQVRDRLRQPVRNRPEQPTLALVNAGETLAYTLYWQTKAETNEPYVSFVHLTDRNGQPLAQYDHLPGPLFLPPAIWATYNQYPDQFLVAIPQAADSGLYWPNVGMYNWKDLHRIAVQIQGSDNAGDHLKLSPIKVVNRMIRSQGRSRAAAFGAMATLVSYELAGETAGTNNEWRVQPGAPLLLTTYYRVKTPSEQELRRFVQLRNAANQIVAQFDSEPQDGINPTWAWLPGELVRDTVALQIPTDAAVDTYTLYLGFYQPTANFDRLPVVDGNGVAVANHEYPLLTITVTDAPIE